MIAWTAVIALAWIYDGLQQMSFRLYVSSFRQTRLHAFTLFLQCFHSIDLRSRCWIMLVQVKLQFAFNESLNKAISWEVLWLNEKTNFYLKWQRCYFSRYLNNTSETMMPYNSYNFVSSECFYKWQIANVEEHQILSLNKNK